MEDNPLEKAELVRAARQLRRLEILMDVIFALIIWRFFTLLPKPSQEGDWQSPFSFLLANHEPFIIAGIGIVIVILYWVQNNTLFGYLERTDTCHTSITILQIFFLLLFLYAIRIGLDFPGQSGARFFESTTAALVGIASIAGWRRAMKNRRLLSSDVANQRVQRISDEILAEPIAAGITIPCAFIGPVVWEIAWLSYLPICYWLRRRHR